MYGDGISTTFYHRESLWAHRRGQGEALRDFQYCQYSSIKEEKSDWKREGTTEKKKSS